MKIAVLSGKGGTGKTLLSVNLAEVSKDAYYIDCDVEEPNGHLFFKPEQIVTEDITVKIPSVDMDKCIGCRRCVDFCKYNALALIKEKLVIFEEICHSCNGCILFCPTKALSKKYKIIGRVHKGISDNVCVISGMLNTGEATGVTIIKNLLNQYTGDKKYTFIDCPPGSGCSVIESIKDADYCLLVAEPTIFGAYNLKMVHELVKIFGKPYGAVLNKCLDEDNPSEKYCLENNIKIIGRIPFDDELGRLNSNGFIASRESEKYQELFYSLFNDIEREASYETAANT